MGRRVTLGVLFLFGITLSRHNSGDSLLYALQIESGEYLLDPTHVLLHPAGWAWVRLWQGLGWSGRAIVPLQVLNALAGVLCVHLLWRIVEQMRPDTDLTTWIALGFAFSGGLWLFSSDAEFVTIPLAVQLWVLLVLFIDRSRRSGMRHGWRVAVATLTWLNSVALIPTAIVGIWLDPMCEMQEKRREIGRFLLTTALFIIPAITLALWLWSDGDWQQVRYLGGRQQYGGFAWFNVPHGAYAFLQTLVLFPATNIATSTRDYLAAGGTRAQLMLASYAVVMIPIAALPVITAMRQCRVLWQRQRRPVVVLLIWSGLNSAFALQWVAGDLTFWMPLLATWWLLLAMAVPPTAVWRRALPVLVVGLLIANGAFSLYPRRDRARNPFWQTAQLVSAETTPSDVIITDPGDLSYLYITYFSQRQSWIIVTSPERWPADRIQFEPDPTMVEAAGGTIYWLDTKGTLVKLTN